MNNKALLMDAMLYSMEGEDASRSIENQQKRDQALAVRSSRLPSRSNSIFVPREDKLIGTDDSMTYEEKREIINKNNRIFTKNQYEKMGIKVLNEYDDLFYSVELPEGWEIRPTDHGMWNDVVDDKGRVRIEYFYKSAFYDRDAFSNFTNRYSYKILPFDDYKSNASYEERKSKPWSLHITDCGDSIKVLKEGVKYHFGMDEELREIATQYFNENYPKWEDINSYWD